MPTYEYACDHCGHKFELFQKITDRRLDKCPKCAKPVRRLIGSGAGIIFRGKKDSAPKAPCPNTKEGCNACPYNK